MELNDVLNPPIFKLDDFRFRKMRIADDISAAEELLQELPQHCMSKIETLEDYEDEEKCEDLAPTLEYTITETPNGFEAKLDLPSVFFRHIIGQKGMMRKKIEEETSVRVKLPPVGKEGVVVLTGASQRNILSAITRIGLIVEGQRKKMPFTHFLSFPVTSDDVIASFERFRSDVLLNCPSPGVDSSIFQNSRKLHLTLGVMSLYGDKEVGRVEEVMKETTRKLKRDGLMEEGGMGVEVEGLEVMNDDLTAVDVLYAKVKMDEDRLQTIADAYVSALVDSSFMSRQFDRVKLHVTLMNTLFRRDEDVDNHHNFRFGHAHFRHLHLSRRGKVTSNGYYAPDALVPL